MWRITLQSSAIKVVPLQRKNKRMKTLPNTPIQQVVCKNVKALLIERKISVRELAIGINKDHSQLNKILNNQAILPAYLIDDFAFFFRS